MKISFVYPRFEKFLRSVPELDAGLIDYFLGDYTTPPSLGIPLLAALTPPGFAVELIDDNSGQPLDYAAPTDFVNSAMGLNLEPLCPAAGNPPATKTQRTSWKCVVMWV